MAKKTTPFRNTFTTGAKAQRELKDRLQQDLNERLAAQTILNPDEVAGDYDFKRLLFTTLGGVARPLTLDDLQAFRASARVLGNKYKGGIRAKQVIDLSLPDDRKRANEQIRQAIPVTYRGGRIQFQTNAGPNSDQTRHQVIVELLNYDAAVASPKPPMKIVGEMLGGPIKIECDCGRWRYWYRYIATIGKYNAGRNETGYPKIRNPQLHGVACKHILRVMQLIAQSPSFKNYAAQMIDKGRSTLIDRRQVVKVKDMEKLAEQLKAESWRQRSIRTTEEKRAARSKTPIAVLRGQAEAKAKQKEARKQQRDQKTAMRGLEVNARKLLQLGAINQQQFEAMMAAVRAG